MLEKKVLVSLSTDTKRKLDELSSEFGLPPAVVARYAIYRLLDESGRGFIDKPIGLAGPAFRAVLFGGRHSLPVARRRGPTSGVDRG